MKLKETYCSKKPYSLIEITVEYNPDANEVEDLISVKAKGVNCVVDITNQCTNGLSRYFDDIIDNIDWRSIYRELKIDQERTFNKFPSMGKI